MRIKIIKWLIGEVPISRIVILAMAGIIIFEAMKGFQ